MLWKDRLCLVPSCPSFTDSWLPRDEEICSCRFLCLIWPRTHRVAKLWLKLWNPLKYCFSPFRYLLQRRKSDKLRGSFSGFLVLFPGLLTKCVSLSCCALTNSSYRHLICTFVFWVSFWENCRMGSRKL